VTGEWFYSILEDGIFDWIDYFEGSTCETIRKKGGILSQSNSLHQITSLMGMRCLSSSCSLCHKTVEYIHMHNHSVLTGWLRLFLALRYQVAIWHQQRGSCHMWLNLEISLCLLRSEICFHKQEAPGFLCVYLCCS
jgi:hypothetical protein